jgi:hypothetical protein
MDLKIDSLVVDEYQLEILALQSFYTVYKYDHIKDDTLQLRPSWANKEYACKNIIWLNRDLDEIGFIGISACRILKIDEIKYLEVSNILPAKGPGSTELSAILKSENNNIERKEIFFERGAYFDYCEVEMIRKFSQLNVLILADGYDC